MDLGIMYRLLRKSDKKNLKSEVDEMISIALGEDVFENYIDNSQIYIDKSLFIRDVIDNGNKVILLTRPRRFGKSVNYPLGLKNTTGRK